MTDGQTTAYRERERESLHIYTHNRPGKYVVKSANTQSDSPGGSTKDEVWCLRLRCSVYFKFAVLNSFIFNLSFPCVYCTAVRLCSFVFHSIIVHMHYLSALFMAALWNRQAIIFLPCGYYLSIFLSIFFSSPNLSGRRLYVYHTSTHGVALVRI